MCLLLILRLLQMRARYPWRRGVTRGWFELEFWREADADADADADDSITQFC